jgi:hypothetical protein
VTKATQARYVEYDQTCGPTCPSCRAEWITLPGPTFQAVHKDACKYIVWWTARYAPTTAVAA